MERLVTPGNEAAVHAFALWVLPVPLLFACNAVNTEHVPIIVLVQLVLSVMIAQQTAPDRLLKLSIVPLLGFLHEQYYLLGWQQCKQLIDV